MDTSGTRKLHYGFIIVISIFIQMFLGGAFLQTAGLFVLPVTQALDINQGTYMMYMTVQYVVMAITATFAPKLLSRFRFGTLNRCGIVIMGLGILLMSIAKSVFVIYVGGALIGIGQVAVLFLAPGTLIPRFFKSRVGVMLATAVMGLSIAGVVMNPVVSGLLGRATVLGMEAWRGTYVILGAGFIVLGLLNAFILLRDEPGPEGRYGEDAAEAAGEGAATALRGVSKSKAVKSLSFVWLVVMLLAWNVGCQIFVYLAPYAGFTPAATSSSFDLTGFIGSVAMIGSIVGGYLIGGANDRFGARGGATVAGACGVVACLLMLLFQSQAGMILAGAALFGVFYAIANVQLPAMVTTLYGERDYGSIYPVAAAFSPWFGAISSSLWGFVYDATGSYNPMLIAGIGLTALTAIACFMAIRAGKKLPVE